MTDREVAARPVDLTPEWLSSVLGQPVVEGAVQPIGTGQMGASYRVSLTYGAGGEGPDTLVAKLACEDERARAVVGEGYRKEVGFYTRLADTVDVRVPGCWYGAITADADRFTLLLDDLAPARPGVQRDGCTVPQARAAVSNLAGLHAPRWADDRLHDEDFLTPTDTDTASFIGDLHVGATEEFVARYRGELSEEDIATLRDAAQVSGAWLTTRARPFALVHGDYRLDNLMFAPDGEAVTALDWQTVSTGPPLRDVAYFLGNSLETVQRRAHEEGLVADYHRELVARGVVHYSSDDCWSGYRLGQLQGPLITTMGAVYATAERSTASDEMFLTMAMRSCAAIRDLRSLDLV